MKTLHTILTILFGIDLIYATYKLVQILIYFSENNVRMDTHLVIGMIVGNYLLAAILFLARHFVGKKIKSQEA